MKTKSIGVCLLFMALMAHAADKEAHHDAHKAAHWGYSGEHGPAEWGGMEPGFSECKLGKEQSPIDIRDAKVAKLPALDLHYAASGAEVVNNGHTIQVNLANGGALNLDGVPYKLVQFHFHAPSEEQVNGEAFSMVIHMVHQNANGKLAVVAVLLKEGKSNAILAPIFEKLPQSEGKKMTLAGTFSPIDILPVDHGYFKFIGSLTTPPCSEGVRWQVLKQPVEVSKEQIAAFRKLYPMNARPVQPVNGRKIEQS
jgi:carbonic anhydrase